MACRLWQHMSASVPALHALVAHLKPNHANESAVMGQFPPPPPWFLSLCPPNTTTLLDKSKLLDDGAGGKACTHVYVCFSVSFLLCPC